MSGACALADGEGAHEHEIVRRREMRVQRGLLGTYPMRRLYAIGSSDARIPPSEMSPALGSSSPTTRLTVVLLPDPFGPR